MKKGKQGRPTVCTLRGELYQLDRPYSEGPTGGGALYSDSFFKGVGGGSD